jgi:CheY-like chemotaxis protein
VLIVDDNVDAASLLAEVITALGHEVRVAHDGPIAIDAARELEPDVALVDIELPSMTGYELADLLGREPWAADLHVVAVTGHAHETDRQRSRAAGFHDHVVKPLDLATVRRIIGGSGEPTPS